MSKDLATSLLAAAQQLDDDLSRFQSLSSDLSRAPVNSEKTLQRARQALQACSTHEGKLAESLRAFARAMQHVQQTQHACMEATAEAARRIAQRHAERMELQDRLTRLGESARAVSTPFSELPEPSSTTSSQALAPLAEVERRLDAVIAEAAEAYALAEQGDWADLQRDTQSLREQLLSLRNRVLLMRRKLSGDAPS
jgi:chromosome segregation ATPase